MVDIPLSPEEQLALTTLTQQGFPLPLLLPGQAYSPWSTAYWSVAAQTILREKQPALAEKMIAAAALMPLNLPSLLTLENPYLTNNLELQKQVAEFLPATSLRLRQQAKDWQSHQLLTLAMQLKEAKAKRIIRKRECTQFTYGYQQGGVKVRSAVLRSE